MWSEFEWENKVNVNTNITYVYFVPIALEPWLNDLFSVVT